MSVFLFIEVMAVHEASLGLQWTSVSLLVAQAILFPFTIIIDIRNANHWLLILPQWIYAVMQIAGLVCRYQGTKYWLFIVRSQIAFASSLDVSQ